MHTFSFVSSKVILNSDVRYLLHTGKPLLTLQSGGWRDLRSTHGVQRQCVQEQVVCWAFEPHRGPLLLQNGLGVRVGTCGGYQDRCSRTGGAGGVRRPGSLAGTVLRWKHASVGCAAIFNVRALTSPRVKFSLHLHKVRHMCWIRVWELITCKCSEHSHQT